MRTGNFFLSVFLLVNALLLRRRSKLKNFFFLSSRLARDAFGSRLSKDANENGFGKKRWQEVNTNTLTLKESFSSIGAQQSNALFNLLCVV